MTQMLMFPDPRPLVERLGRDFFRCAPENPGVYLMRDAADRVLYVGKAKNLKNRLAHYRVANPDRLARRHLRLLSLVVRIELNECADERSALARESELLLQMRPRFNRAGTWPKPRYYFQWKLEASGLRMGVAEQQEDEWTQHGPISGAKFLLACVGRLIWLTLHPDRGADRLPYGWLGGQRQREVVIEVSDASNSAWAKLPSVLSDLFWAGPASLANWVLQHRQDAVQAFTAQLIAQDLEQVAGMFPRTAGYRADSPKEGMELRA